MSDCSTQAMNPKEPPKTCGNCNRYFNVRPTMRQGTCPLDDLDEHGCAPIHNEDDEACDDWRAIEIPIEQRYQQLEQVARDLYNSAWCAWWLKTNYSLPDLDKETMNRVADSYLQKERDQLKSLGVIIDE